MSFYILAASPMQYLFGILLFLTAVFLILLVLVQRGRGGGLTGALGGMGGQSAFGSKAGDVFTRITIVAATVWSLLCLVSFKAIGCTDTSHFGSGGAPTGVRRRVLSVFRPVFAMGAVSLDSACHSGQIDADGKPAD